MDTELEKKVIASLVAGQLPCFSALRIAKECRVPPKQIGEAADSLGIRLVECQLGCFIYTGLEESVSTEHLDQTLQDKLTTSLVNDRLPCPVAFKIAKELKTTLQEVGKTADALGFRISSCQLGCF
ncbi:MAG: hypothetical protein HY528_02815 [Chloroflexi bacterium]|nr:hypothetical protein [Chloroflexota bacterium]